MLNIQPLATRSSLHSSSFSECVEGKAYNEKIQCIQMIIHDIDTLGTFVVEFLHISRRHWHAIKHTKLRVTSIDPVFIEE